MPRYMFLLQQSPSAHDGVSPEKMQKIVQKYTAWRRRLEAEDRYHGGKKLFSSGRRVSKGSGEVMVTDGPFPEGKEMLAGYFLVEAHDYDHAVALAREAPHLEYGTVEIREIEFE